MQVLESVIERRFVGAMLRIGVRTLKLNLMGNRGYPDRLVILPKGRSVFIEFKKPKGVAEPAPEALQDYIHKQLRKLGHDVKVFDNDEKAKNYIIEKIKEVGAPHIPKEGG